jgi:hypothetical protein
MPYSPRGPREWRPGMKAGVVQGPYDDAYSLRFLRNIRFKKDLRSLLFPDFRINAELAVGRKDPVDLYVIDREQGGEKKNIGELLWFPSFRRGGIITWKDWEQGQIEADWTDAKSELDALERWVWGEMQDLSEEA